MREIDNEVLTLKVEKYLQNYKKLNNQIKSLERQPVGAGYTVNALDQDDQLQELHRQLRGLPSYMYLNAHEQVLETTANAYMTRLPAGTRSQLRAVPSKGYDVEDTDSLNELKRKIRRVIEARAGHQDEDAYETVLTRMEKLQFMKEQLEHIEYNLSLIDEYQTNGGKLLRMIFIDCRSLASAARELNVSERTARRIKREAVDALAAIVQVNET